MSTLHVFRGDYKPLKFTVYDDEGQPLDLTPFDLSFIVRSRSWNPPFIEKTLEDGIEIGTTTGEVTISLESEDTDVTPSRYDWRLRVIDPTEKPRTVAQGRLEVE